MSSSSDDVAARWRDPADAEAQRSWNALLDASPQRSPFATLVYAEAVAEAFELTLRMALVPEADGAAAGMLVYEKRRGPFRLAVMPPLTPYAALLVAGEPPEHLTTQQRDPLSKLLPLLEEHFDAVALNLPPSLTDVRPLTWAGYGTQVRYTYAGPLPEHEDFLRGASKSRRSRHRKGMQALRLEQDADPALTYEALGHVYDRQDDTPPVPAEVFTRLARRLKEAGLLYAHALYEEAPSDTMQAARTVLCDGHTASFWAGGSLPGPAMTCMSFEAAALAWERGARYLDLVGANMASIAEFKRGFGLPLVPYVRAVRVRHPALRLVHAFRPLL